MIGIYAYPYMEVSITMKKFFFTLLVLLMTLFVVNQGFYAWLVTHALVFIVAMGVASFTLTIIVLAYVAFDNWYQKHVYTSIQEWRERDRERARTLARYNHINRLR